MATHYTKDESGRVVCLITVADIYRYKGFTFEFHRLFGPTKLKKDWEPAARQGLKFYRVIDEWNNLPPEQKAATQIAG